MVPDAEPWWSSIQEAEKTSTSAHPLLESFGEGINKWPARWQKKVAMAVNPEFATKMEDWAGWREHYMPSGDN